MRVANGWRDYELLDTSGGERLERWGNIVLIRPDPQIIWHTPKSRPEWKNAHARYLRSNTGGGKWERYKPIPEEWQIAYGDLKFIVNPMGFKHTGVFPEQAVNWDMLRERVTDFARTHGEKPKVLNLFAYTGGATLACAAAGAEVTHVDASKGMVTRARENARESGLADKPVRWLVDDCVKFVEREIRRGRTYDGIVMDPPSYGRGPGGEVWQFENEIHSLVEKCARLLGDRASFFVVSFYTAGLSPSVMSCLLGSIPRFAASGRVRSEEIGLPVTAGDYVLPCGSTAFWLS